MSWRLQGAVQAKGDVGVLGGVGAGFLDRHAVEGDLFLAFAAEVLEVNGRMVEMKLGELVHAVAVLGAIDHVGEHQRVVIGRKRQPGAGEDAEIVFQMMPDLQNRWVRKNRPKAFDDRVAVELACHELAEIVPMPDRDIGALALLNSKTHADQLRRHHVERRGLGVDREDAFSLAALQPLVQHGQLGDRDIGLAIRPRLRQVRAGGRCPPGFEERLETLGERVEIVRAGELQELGVVDIGGLDLVEPLRQRGFFVKGHQLLRDARELGIFDQVFPAFLLLDGLGAFEQAFEVAELFKQECRRLDADAGHAWNVVGGVAGKRQDVANLLGTDAELFHDLVAADLLRLHRIVHLDAVADQLHQVLVRGDDRNRPAVCGGLFGVGGDDVVGLIAFELDHRHPESVGGVPDQRELRDQIFRRLVAVGLVLGVHVVAEAVRAFVEHHDHLIVRPILSELEQHVAETEDGAYRCADLVCQRRQREERAKDVARAVDQKEAGLFGCGFGRKGGLGHDGHRV